MADFLSPDVRTIATCAALGSTPCRQPLVGTLDHWASKGWVGLYENIHAEHDVAALAHLSVLLFPKPRCCVISFLYDCTVLLLYLGIRALRLELKKEWWSTQDLHRFLQVFGHGSARETSQSWVSPCSRQNTVGFLYEAFKILVQSSVYSFEIRKCLLCFMKRSTVTTYYGPGTVIENA